MQVKYILIGFLFFLLVGTAFSLSVGPGRVEYLYKPGLEGEFNLTITENTGRPVDLVVYAEGSLAEYITISTPNFHLNANEVKVISYSFKLPDDLNSFGRNENLIIVKTTIPPKERTSTISAAVAIAHQFWVHVPFPKVFIEPRLKVENVTLESVKSGDPIFLDVTLINLGSEDAPSKIDFLIKNSKGEVIYRFEPREKLVKKGEQEIVQYDWYVENPSQAEAGIYTAVANVDFSGDKPTSASGEFKIGVATVLPKSVKVNEFELGQIAKIEVMLESIWSSPIPGAYAKIFLLNESKEVIRNPSPSASVTVSAWDEMPVEIFLDTSGLDKKVYDMNVVIYFSNRETSKIFKFDATGSKVDESKSTGANTISMDMFLMILGGFVVVVIIVFIILFLFLSKRMKP
ncbi:MAG: hypothetical protein PHD05_03080 [Sphaerochaetaceae bacterium]|nr:hypothetical protein [Sphaerochaetaceae bacterium]